jgi:hypothetical protein
MTEPNQPNTVQFDASFIDAIAQDEIERKEVIDEFIENMSRPGREVAEDAEDTPPSVSDEKNDKNKSGGSASDDDSDNTGASEGKETFNLFDFLELDNVAEWWEGALIFSATEVHDFFDDSKEIAEAREQIVNRMSAGGLNDEQLKFLKLRYDELGEALKERKEGRENIKEDIEFPDKIKAKFNQLFKKWIDTKNINVDLSPGWALVIMAIAMMVYSLFVVGKTRYSYRKV